MGSLKVAEVLGSLNQRSSLGRIVINPPTTMAIRRVHATGNISICCGIAFLSQESLDTHCSQKDNHYDDLWNSQLKKKPPEIAKRETSGRIISKPLRYESNGRKENSIITSKNILPSEGVTGKRKVCKLCGLVTSEGNYNRHIRTSHDPKSEFKCRWCCCRLPTEYAAFSHSRRIHPEEHKKFCWNKAAQNEHVISARKMKSIHDLDLAQLTNSLSNEKEYAKAKDSDLKLDEKQKKQMEEMLKTTGSKENHECTICGKVVGSKASFRNHLLIHTGDRPYNCELCSFTFRYKSSLNRHFNKVHAKQLKFKCKKCKHQAFFTQESLNDHMKKVHRVMFISQMRKQIQKRKKLNNTERVMTIEAIRVDNGFRCRICGKILKSLYTYRGHLLIHANLRPERCPHCDRSFRLKTTLITHIQRYHVENGKFKCDKCVCTFKYFRVLVYHMRRHHGDKIEVTGEKSYNLTKTPNRSSPLRVKESIKFAASVVTASTSAMSVNFTPPRNSSEKKSIDESVNGSNLSKGPYECHICGKVLSRPHILKAHMRIHTNSLPFRCPKCPARFRHQNGVQNHLKSSHSEDAKFQCPKCPCRLRSAGLVNHHIVLYHNKAKKNVQRPIQVAGKINKDSPQKLEFKTSAIESKSSNKRSSWEETIETVANNGDLLTKITPYQCRICKKGFMSPDNLRRHHLSHQKYFPFKCPECPAKFRLDGTRKVHMKRSHSSLGKWKCPKCSCKLQTWFGLRQHMSRHHHEYFLSTLKKKPATLIVKNKKPGASYSNDLRDKDKNEILHKQSPKNGNSPKRLKMVQELKKKASSTLDVVTDINVEMKTPIALKKGLCKCRICDKIITKKNFSAHLMIHTNSFPYECPKCPAKFRTYSVRRVHLQRNHVEDGEFQCRKCPCRFQTNSRLKTHITNYHVKTPEKGTEEKVNIQVKPQLFFPPSPIKRLTARAKVRPIRSFINSTSPASSQSFINVIHTPEIPVEKNVSSTSEKKKKGRIPVKISPSRLKCKTCDKVFVCPQSKRLHESVHTGMMEYKCDYCGMEFRLYSSLMLHIRKYESSMHGEFRCNKCSARCATEESLNHHKAIHKYKKKSYNKK